MTTVKLTNRVDCNHSWNQIEKPMNYNVLKLKYWFRTPEYPVCEVCKEEVFKKEWKIREEGSVWQMKDMSD